MLTPTLSSLPSTPNAGNCRVIVAPTFAKVREAFEGRMEQRCKLIGLCRDARAIPSLVETRSQDRELRRQTAVPPSSVAVSHQTGDSIGSTVSKDKTLAR
jgi:hypothetical protein